VAAEVVAAAIAVPIAAEVVAVAAALAVATVVAVVQAAVGNHHLTQIRVRQINKLLA